MSTPRIHIAMSLASGSSVSLDEGGSKHLLRVLRRSVGDAVTLFNGDGNDYHGQISVIEDRRATITIEASAPTNSESKLNITLGQALSRGQRFEFTVQKAVELGAAAITPLATERSGGLPDEKRSANRLARWQQIAVSAAEQSGRSVVTAIEQPILLDHWLRRPRENTLCLLFDPLADQSLSDLPPSSTVTLLVGPEGGLSTAELDSARSAGFQGVRMGPRILRTETAGPAAIAALQALWGDF